MRTIGVRAIIVAAVVAGSVAILVPYLQREPGLYYGVIDVAEAIGVTAVHRCEVRAACEVWAAIGAGTCRGVATLAAVSERDFDLLHCSTATTVEPVEALLTLRSLAPESAFGRVILADVEVVRGGEWIPAARYNGLLRDEGRVWRRTAHTSEIARLPEAVVAGDDPCVAAGLDPGCGE